MKKVFAAIFIVYICTTCVINASDDDPFGNSRINWITIIPRDTSYDSPFGDSIKWTTIMPKGPYNHPPKAPYKERMAEEKLQARLAYDALLKKENEIVYKLNSTLKKCPRGSELWRETNEKGNAIIKGISDLFCYVDGLSGPNDFSIIINDKGRLDRAQKASKDFSEFETEAEELKKHVDATLQETEEEEEEEGEST